MFHGHSAGFMNGAVSADEVIRRLGLVPHDEGGFYRPVFSPTDQDQASRSQEPGTAHSYSSIFYLLTAEDPIGYLHVNKADIVHCFHGGAPLTYLLVSPDGRLARQSLGPDPACGQQLQLIVHGGTWKATVLESGEFGLVSEVVIPAFDRRDREFATPERVRQLFPWLWPELARFVRNDE